MRSSTAEILPFPNLPEGMRLDEDSGALEIDTDDGGVIIDFNPDLSFDDEEDANDNSPDHDKNLAEVLGEGELDTISGHLLEGIDQDDRSRAEWLEQRSRGIDLLGLKLEKPRGDLGSSGAPMEGMSTVRHPLLLEAAMRFQANARGELLPSGGPVKIANVGQGTVANDDQARQLQKSMNAYITRTCTEYYPDTDKLLFQVGWSGAGFKKGYHCPLKRRPVIESVDAKDLIVSNNATDIQSASRITHVIKMSPSVLIRMQIAGAYRDVDISSPVAEEDVVAKKIDRIQGRGKSTRPEDADHTIYECYCDYDIPGYEHKLKGKLTGLPLPYKVVIDKTSRKVLEIRRNWKEGDEDFKKKRTFVLYPFVPMFGFYPSGLLHILGNTTNAITAAWRVLLDSGMFANFPGFLYAKNGDRQKNNSFRVAPGSGAPIDVAGGDLSKAIMPLPYKEPGPASMQLVQDIATTGQRVGGTAEAQVGEGNAQAPVGTTLALIEQAQQIISAVHKRIHAAQSEEFQMLKELLQEDPEALWRHDKINQAPWNADTLVAALENYDLVPMADPNTPSHMHRLMKLMGVKQLQAANPTLYDAKAVDEFCLREMGIEDPERFFAPPQPPQQAAPDPNIIKAQAQQQAAQLKAMTQAQSDQLKAKQSEQSNQIKLLDIQARTHSAEMDRASRENLAKMQLAERLAVHPMSTALFTPPQMPGQANP
jgi:hypothetical protein